MKILLVNSVCGVRSTGRICAKIAEEHEARGWEVRIGYGRLAYVPESCRKWAVRIGGTLSVRMHVVLTRLFDWHADRICSWWSTRRFLKWAETWKPDVLWLHNLHGYYINYELLFKWIKKHPEMDVKWTLHDCWAYTGHCAYFTYSGCEKWEKGCHHCLCKRDYPRSALQSSAKSNWMRKRTAFCGVKKMTLITPSKWLADLTRRSFLNEYPVQVVHNEIDLSVFHLVTGDIKSRLGIGDKKMILGVASTWDVRKGLDDFVALSSLVGRDYVIVLVGLSELQLRQLPVGIRGLRCTHDVHELVELYSAADWFFNPTREDNFPTVNLEAKACGCRVVTYDTGGSSETVEGYDRAWVLSGKDKSPRGFLKIIQAEDKLCK